MNSNTFNIKEFVQHRGGLLGQVLAAIFILISLFIIAKLVWLWVEYAQPAQALKGHTSPIVQTQNSKQVNVNKLVDLHVFGIADAAETQQVQATETRLKLKLMGTYVASQEDSSSAIIQSNGSKQKTYLVNEQIGNNRRVTLHQVDTEHVIIKNNGKLEKLTLIENLNQAILDSKQTTKTPKTDARTIDKRKDSRLTNELVNIKNKLYDSPESFADLATFQPAVDESGQVTGFKVGPGKDPRLFTRLGLRRNDIIRSVNGQGMDNQGYMTALQELQGADSIELSIERNGQPVTLLLSLGGEQQASRTQQSNSRQPNELELK